MLFPSDIAVDAPLTFLNMKGLMGAHYHSFLYKPKQWTFWSLSLTYSKYIISFLCTFFQMNDTISITSGMNYTNYEEEDDKSEIEGGWGSSSYSDNLNSTMNMTNEEFLRLYLGPNQVNEMFYL